MRTLSWLAFILVAAECAMPAQVNWKLVWSDEFDGAANTAPDPAKWTYDLGGGGWGNRELETYTNRADNVFQDGNGNLVIRALRNDAGAFTSARLKTQGKFSVQYGKIEAKIKIPYGQGMWPAFWMLGENINAAGWPACGEIDIMENIGKEPAIAHGSMHGPGYSGNTPLTSKYSLAGAQKLSDAFHVFAIEWSPKGVAFSVDRQEYYRVTPASLPAGTAWVYDAPFFLLLNLAVGGSWPGNPDDTTVFPQTMLVDYVRVWQASSDRITSPHAGSPLPIPGTIQAEDFDDGGEGLAYHDREPANLGGAYRNEGVDIEPTGDGAGFDVGWIKGDEWLLYTVNVAGDGNYNFDAMVASDGPGGTFHIEADGVDLTGPLTIPDTGGWQSWQTLTARGLKFTAGVHILRLVMDSEGPGGYVGNFDAFTFSAAQT